MSKNCDVIAIFVLPYHKESYVNVIVSKSKFYLQFLFNPIYGQFGAIWKSNSGRIVCKTYIFINSNLLSYKIWKQNKKISNITLTLSL